MLLLLYSIGRSSPKVLPMIKEEIKMVRESMSPVRRACGVGDSVVTMVRKYNLPSSLHLKDEETDKELRHIY